MGSVNDTDTGGQPCFTMAAHPSLVPSDVDIDLTSAHPSSPAIDSHTLVNPACSPTWRASPALTPLSRKAAVAAAASVIFPQAHAAVASTRTSPSSNRFLEALVHQHKLTTFLHRTSPHPTPRSPLPVESIHAGIATTENLSAAPAVNVSLPIADPSADTPVIDVTLMLSSAPLSNSSAHRCATIDSVSTEMHTLRASTRMLPSSAASDSALRLQAFPVRRRPITVRLSSLTHCVVHFFLLSIAFHFARAHLCEYDSCGRTRKQLFFFDLSAVCTCAHPLCDAPRDVHTNAMRFGQTFPQTQSNRTYRIPLHPQSDRK